MIVYEVNLKVDADIAGAFGDWLQAHVEDMLALDGFLGARIFQVDVEAPGTVVEYCTRYQLMDRAALEYYLSHHASRMRDAGLKRFPGAFSATRRVMRPV